MEIVGSTARDHVNDCAVVAAVFGREIVGKDAKFLGGIGILRSDAAQAAGNVGIVVGGSIKQEIVIALAAAVDGDAAETAIRLGDAGAEQHKLIRIAQDQRQLNHLGVLYDVAEGWRLGIHVGNGVGIDFHGGRQVAHFNLTIEGAVVF